MGSRVSGLCRVCQLVNATEEEHVFPAGFLRRIDRASTAPHVWKTNGKVVLKKNGQPTTPQPTSQRMFLPVCRSCNDNMDRLIEKPAQSVATNLYMGNWTDSLTREQWRDVGRWWYKILMMQANPDLRIGDAGLQAAGPLAPMSFSAPLPDLSWFARTATPPEGASLFIYNVDISGIRAKPVIKHRLVLPRGVKFADGSTSPCHRGSIVTIGAGLMAVWHPWTRDQASPRGSWTCLGNSSQPPCRAGLTLVVS